MTETPDTQWDPIHGAVPFRREEPPAPTGRIVLPRWIGTLGLLMAMAGIPALIWAALDPVPERLVPAIGLFVAGFALSIVPSILAREGATRAHLYGQTAKRLGWGFERMATSYGEAATLRGEGAVLAGPPAKGEDYVDPRVMAVAQRVPELMRARLGQPIMTRIDAVFRGHAASRRVERPFWLGLSSANVNASLGTASVRRDAHGGAGTSGLGFTLCAAFPLERDTGVRAAILAEAFGDGKDVDTESSAFNDAFSLRLTEGDEAGLIRALTPAAQTTLLDLKERYGTQAVLDGDTLWLTGVERLMGVNEERVAELLDRVVSDFADAAVALTRYAE